jgi:hypothetical protein
MAAERAEIMHRTIQPSFAAVGMPPAASMAAQRANGRAKIECSHLIISRVVLMLVRRGTEYFILKSRAERGTATSKGVLGRRYLSEKFAIFGAELIALKYLDEYSDPSLCSGFQKESTQLFQHP